MNNTNTDLALILVRGLPGAGKTAFAKFMAEMYVYLCPVISADDYFTQKDGTYQFVVSKLKDAHLYSQQAVEKHMQTKLEKIFVANTFTTEEEMAPYYKLADVYKYKVYSVIVENRHNGKSVHNVPEETIVKMKERFNINL